MAEDKSKKELNFTLQLAEIPVVLDNKNYKLVELSGETQGSYLNSVGDRVKVTDGKITGMRDYKGIQADLLCLCLYDSEDVLVPKKVIQSFPASVLAKLYEAAQELNGLDDEADVSAKND